MIEEYLFSNPNFRVGQKVANKNLKNGVYFIAVAGESIKVVK